MGKKTSFFLGCLTGAVIMLIILVTFLYIVTRPNYEKSFPVSIVDYVVHDGDSIPIYSE